MSILPLIDLLIWLAWTSLAAGGILKAINIALSKYWTVLGLAPFDLFMISGMLLVFALTLIGRTWVKEHEPSLLAAKRAEATREAYAELVEPPSDEPQAAVAGGASWPRRSLEG